MKLITCLRSEAEQMAEYLLKKGYNIKIAGRAERALVELPEPDFIALQPNEFRGIKPKLMVMEGNIVKIGTPLFHRQSKSGYKICISS